MEHKFISLGAGVQSSTMALMAEHGLLPKPDFAVFADTLAEPESVYKWLDFLEQQLSFPVYRISKGSLEDDSLRISTAKNGNTYLPANIPLFTLKNGKKGIMNRQCTTDYKVRLIYRFVRDKYGVKFRRNLKERFTYSLVLDQWLGISTDEATRMKDSYKPYIKNVYPLIDLGLSRQDCLDWMKGKYPEPPRSACVFCPYHSDKEWIRLRDTEPAEFERAVNYEKKLHQIEGIKGYLHQSRVPLDEVVFKEGKDGFENDCSGHCGV